MMVEQYPLNGSKQRRSCQSTAQRYHQQWNWNKSM